MLTARRHQGGRSSCGARAEPPAGRTLWDEGLRRQVQPHARRRGGRPVRRRRARPRRGTHDQGVVATVAPEAGRQLPGHRDRRSSPTPSCTRSRSATSTATASLEVYATPERAEQARRHARSRARSRATCRRRGEGRRVVADLGDRHAKEILVERRRRRRHATSSTSSVEAVTEGAATRIVEPVEIRRYDAGTDPDRRRRDRHARRPALPLPDRRRRRRRRQAARWSRRRFKSGLWLLRPGADPKGRVDEDARSTRNSSGFEHAAILADLDGDGTRRALRRERRPGRGAPLRLDGADSRARRLPRRRQGPRSPGTSCRCRSSSRAPVTLEGGARAEGASISASSAGRVACVGPHRTGSQCVRRASARERAPASGENRYTPGSESPALPVSPGGHAKGRPPRTCRCRWKTVWPAPAPSFTTSAVVREPDLRGHARGDEQQVAEQRLVAAVDARQAHDRLARDHEQVRRAPAGATSWNARQRSSS